MSLRSGTLGVRDDQRGLGKGRGVCFLSLNLDCVLEIFLIVNLESLVVRPRRRYERVMNGWMDGLVIP